jgi:hypothetical protein
LVPHTRSECRTHKPAGTSLTGPTQTPEARRTIEGTRGWHSPQTSSLTTALLDTLADSRGARLGPIEPPEALVDAREVARLTGKTRQLVYEQARELGAGPLGTGPRHGSVSRPT